MARVSAAEGALRDGDAKLALKLLTDEVRAAPENSNLRVFLFQLLCILGQWDRALNQLNVAGTLDASALAMVQTYREAIQCESLRLQVFAGQKAPLLFGDPEDWIALLIEAVLREGRGESEAARTLRERALELAPTTAGTLNDESFSWIADGDGRLGPTIEAVIRGRYYWVPWSRLTRLDVDPPEDLRDAVWMPAHFTFSNGGETVGLIPTRYPDTDLALGDACAMARRTEWREMSPGVFVGLGQRVVMTDQSEVALMDIRSIELSSDTAR